MNELRILRFTSVGAYLGELDTVDSEENSKEIEFIDNEEDDEYDLPEESLSSKYTRQPKVSREIDINEERDNDGVLLPNKYITDEMEIDDVITVFVYRDSEDRPVATTETPKIKMNGFAFLKVTSVNFFGAFADWGLEKELMIPFKEQNLKVEEGRYYLTCLLLDDKTDRVFGSTRVHRYFQFCDEQFDDNEEVSLLICETTDLGVKVVVNDKYSGLIFHNDISRPIKRGDWTTGYVSKVREEDGKLDIRLDKSGYVKVEGSAEKLLEILKVEKTLNITDKSDPELIREMVGMSKKTFKQAVGNLYKQRLITLEKDRIIYVG
ncbi:MAG: S1-like domain-containing RNA-binding protein [Crocinitomicaceae bacterium]|nr:S1-like domain-containing RNA-binding protein [Crocinitomicaceae bacterium]